MQYCYKFTSVSVCKKYQNTMLFDKVIAKIKKTVQFCLPHSVEWCSYPMVKRFDDMISRFDRIPAYD